MPPEKLSMFPVISTVQVAWGDMDAFQHVNNTRYFRYFEDSRIAYFEACGLLDGEVGPILASASCQFRAPVTFPDTLYVGARVVEVRSDRFRMEHHLWSEALQTIAAKGESLVVSYNFAAKLSVPLPQQWLDAIVKVQGTLPDAG